MPTTTIAVNGTPQQFIVYSGALWVFLEDDSVFPALFSAYRSADNGATWQIQDAANGPTSQGLLNGSPVPSYFDGGQTVTLLRQDGLGTGNFFLKDFSLLTRTWGADYAALVADPNVQPAALFKTSVGDWLACFQDKTTAALVYEMALFSGGVWSAFTDLCAGVEAIGGFDPASTTFNPELPACLDASDVLHVIVNTFAPSNLPWDNRFFYQECSTAGVLSNFAEFPGQNVAPQDLVSLRHAGPGYAPNLIVDGTKIVWGIIRNIAGANAAAAYVGTPVSGPVWSETGALGALPQGYPSLTLRSTGALYLGFVDSLYQVWAAVSSTLFAAFTASVVAVADNLNPGKFPPLVNFGSVLVVTGQGLGEANGPVQFSIPIVPVLRITLRGIKRRPAAC